MKKLLLLFSVMLVTLPSFSQRYITKNGYIGFFSHTPVEDIKAENNQVAGVLDASTGDMVFQVLMRSFHFAKALMEEHFNENYLESDKYPRAEFRGKINDPGQINLSEKGSHDVTVQGDLTIHGVTKPVTAPGTIQVTDDGLIADARFNIAPEDYNITIPNLVRENIAKTVEVTVSMKYAPTNSSNSSK
jgi:hypothetical protein